MTYQVVNLTYANVPDIIIDDYYELIEYVENENYKAKRDGFLGTMLAVRLLSSQSDIVIEKIIPLGYTEYTESILFDFEQQEQSLLGRLKNAFIKIFNKRKRNKNKKGNEPMPPKEDWVYDGEPLDTPEQNDLSPEEERAKIASAIAKQSEDNNTDSEIEPIEIDYKKQYQEEQNHQTRDEKQNSAVEAMPDFKEVITENEPSTPSSQIQISNSNVNEEKSGIDVYDVAERSQDNLIQNMARISEERDLIRQKILENQAIIEKARRAEIENETLEIEYNTQKELLNKLQQFHSLFDEYSEYLN